MNFVFNKHPEIPSDYHSLFSPSSYAFLRYDEEKLEAFLEAANAKTKGTELHDFASKAIRNNFKIRGKGPLQQFVADAIGYKMESEQRLVYSKYVSGTADAISFSKNMLRIHDLKTGKTKAKMDQLLIYAALFCLEYNIKPGLINVELRIYQYDNIPEIYCPTPEEIIKTMDTIKWVSNYAYKYFGGGNE